MSEDTVRLVGGPFAGLMVPRPKGRSILMETGRGRDVGAEVARYRMTRERDVFRFRDYDRIAVRIEVKP